MMEYSEKEIEDYIITHLNEIFEMVARQNQIKVFRQFNLGDYGTPDIIIFINLGCPPNESIPYQEIKIVEIKAGRPHLSDIGQLARYTRGILNFIEKMKIKNVEISPYLISKDFSKGSGDEPFLFSFLEAGSAEKIYFQHIGFTISLENGIEFKEGFGGGWIRGKNNCGEKLAQLLMPPEDNNKIIKAKECQKETQ